MPIAWHVSKMKKKPSNATSNCDKFWCTIIIFDAMKAIKFRKIKWLINGWIFSLFSAKAWYLSALNFLISSITKDTWAVRVSVYTELIVLLWFDWWICFSQSIHVTLFYYFVNFKLFWRQIENQYIKCDDMSIV